MKDFKEAIAKPRKLALYAHMAIDGHYTVWEVRHVSYDEHYMPLPDGQTREAPIQNYVRITEPVDVEFEAIDNDEMVRNAVEALNDEERKAINELNKTIASIRERRNQLLALTHQVEQS
jgi:hypothetical protein